MDKIELQERLVDFAVSILNTTKKLPKDYAAVHLSQQIIRSGTSAALNYGEALGGSSTKDFIYKLKIVIKELRETLISIKILDKAYKQQIDIDLLRIMKENNELISIFFKSIQTAQHNMKSQNQKFEFKNHKS